MLGLLAWLLLLAATIVLAGFAFHFDPTQLPAAFQALAPAQQVAAILIALVALALIASTIWHSWRLAREQQQASAARGGMVGAKKGAAQAAVSQKDFDAAVQHLAGSDPEDALSAIQQQLTDTETRLSVQRGRNEAVDMKERLEDIRRRQQTLREQIGEVAEKRRTIEPVFEELKDRQRQLARSLDKIETDDGSNNFLELLKEFDSKTGPLQMRHQALQDSFALLVSLKDGIAKSQSELVRLQTPETGVKALFGEVQAARASLAKSIEALETTSEGDALNTRVVALDAGKKEAEQRIVRLEGSYAVLDAVRRDLAELKKRQEDLATQLTEVETDHDGKTLNERLAEMDQFSAQARGRLRSLQEILTTLNRYRKDLINSENDLSPLRAPGEGIHGLVEDLNKRHAELVSALEELETSGNQALGTRVVGLADSKRVAEQRIAEVYRYFAQLESLRNEIAAAFADLNSAFKKFV